MSTPEELHDLVEDHQGAPALRAGPVQERVGRALAEVSGLEVERVDVVLEEVA